MISEAMTLVSRHYHGSVMNVMTKVMSYHGHSMSLANHLKMISERRSFFLFYTVFVNIFKFTFTSLKVSVKLALRTH